MRINNIERTNSISFNSIIISSSRTFTALVVFTFLFFFFSSLSDIIAIIFHIPDVYATLDTFSARGTIFIHIDDSISNIDTKIQLPSSSSLNQSTTSFIINNNNIDNTNIITTTTANPSINTNNSAITKEQNAISIIKSIKGKWNLKINKGSPKVFDMLLVSYDQNGIPKNAYGIYNLRDDQFIQLDNRGNEIISGKVDLRSVGEVNKTITDIDATLIIERLQNIRLIVNNENAAISIPNFFNKPIIGKIILMADGIGKILVDKRPKPSSSSSVTPIPSPDVTPNLPPYYTHQQPNPSTPQTPPNSPSPNAVPSPDDSKLPTPPALNTPDTKIR